MTNNINQTKSKEQQRTNPSSEDILTLWKNLPEGTFTIGGVIYPKTQFAEVLEYWFGNEPLPASKWRP